VADGLIWVYGSCQPGAEAAAKSIPLSLRNPELEDPNYKGFRVPWYQRDVPYGADTLLENVRSSTIPSSTFVCVAAGLVSSVSKIPVELDTLTRTRLPGHGAGGGGHPIGTHS
jgi:hypothetical protein